MAQQVINFVKTTLRSAVQPADTVLQLAVGGGSLFAPITAGNYCYITVNDSTTVEVMKYVSSGVPVNDAITVTRAQDNTTAKAFPAGACVTIGWNVEQVTDLISQQLADDFDNLPLPRNTIEATSFAGILGVPPANKYYGINTTTGSLWYWKGPTGADWIYVNSNSVLARTSNPSSPPADNISWCVNTTTNTLFWWSGLTWRQISSAGGSGYLELYDRQYYTGGGGAGIAVPSDQTFGDMVTGGTITVTTTTQYKSNPAISNVITLNGNNQYVFGASCIAELTASYLGTLPDDTSNFHSTLVLFHASGGQQYRNDLVVPLDFTNAANRQVGITATTGPIQVAAADYWDALVSVIENTAMTGFTGFNLTQMNFSAKIIALL